MGALMYGGWGSDERLRGRTRDRIKYVGHTGVDHNILNIPIYFMFAIALICYVVCKATEKKIFLMFLSHFADFRI